MNEDEHHTTKGARGVTMIKGKPPFQVQQTKCHVLEGPLGHGL
jgi:hypothetical protein